MWRVGLAWAPAWLDLHRCISSPLIEMGELTLGTTRERWVSLHAQVELSDSSVGTGAGPKRKAELTTQLLWVSRSPSHKATLPTCAR